MMEEGDLSWASDPVTNSSGLLPSLAPSSSSSMFLDAYDQYDDADDVDEHLSSLTETQDMVLSILPLLSGLLSAYGSANIIMMVYQSKKETRNCYKRLLFGLSCSDFVSSTILGLQPFLLPSDTSNRIWAVGTDLTCSMMGFFQQLSTSNIWYNGMLSFYFLLTIRDGIFMTRCRENVMHILSVGIPLVTALIGLVMGLYGELRVGHFCYFTGPPMATHIAFGVAGLPAFFFFIAIPINNLLVYCHVVRTTQRQRQKGGNDSHKRWRKKNKLNKTAAATTTPALQTATAAASTSCCDINSTNDKLGVGGEDHQYHQSSMLDVSARTGTTFRTTSSSSYATTSTAAIAREQQLELEEQPEKQRENELEQQRQLLQQTREQKRIQQVAFQAFLYVAAYFISYLPTAILRAIAALNSMNASNEADLFPLLVAQAILWPLQGFFNYSIYCRSPPYASRFIRESVVVVVDDDDDDNEDYVQSVEKEDDDRKREHEDDED